jgi:hypothetical protein
MVEVVEKKSKEVSLHEICNTISTTVRMGDVLVKTFFMAVIKYLTVTTYGRKDFYYVSVILVH